MAYMRTDRPGLGELVPTENYAWEFYPPPYNFLAPPLNTPPGMVAPEEAPLLAGVRFPTLAHALRAASKVEAGLGCGCGGSCGGCGGGHHQHGLGLFDSWDVSTWGVGEWATVAVGVYLVGSLFSDTRRAVGTVRKAARSRKTRRRRELEAEIDTL